MDIGLDTAEEMEVILDTMADGLFVLDTERRVRRWNRAMERLTGYSAEETVGQACGVFPWLAPDAESVPAAGDTPFCHMFASGSMDRTELTAVCKDGSCVPVLVSARVLRDAAGRPEGAVVTVTDISTLKRLESEVHLLRKEVEGRYEFHKIVGKSRAMREVFNAIELAGATSTTVLVQGETGTGKELVAKAIHFHSERRGGPLVSVNCSALSESLVESELFGHVRGAFTGATRDHIGRFELAQGGTIFLDEIGEVPMNVQVKLLRAIQEREIERIGESRPRKVDVRIVAATHRDLRERVAQGLFREDLYYRLKVFPISLPSLRERREDIEPLVAHFLRVFNARTGKRIRALAPDAMRMVLEYPWPGNVRELENALEHAFVTCAGREIEPMDLPVEIRRAELRHIATPATPSVPRESVVKSRTRVADREALMEALRASGWNKAEAARRLGITRTQVWRRMVQWEIPLEGDGQ